MSWRDIVKLKGKQKNLDKNHNGVIDVWSSPNIQYSQWLLEMKEKCKVLC